MKLKCSAMNDTKRLLDSKHRNNDILLLKGSAERKKNSLELVTASRYDSAAISFMSVLRCCLISESLPLADNKKTKKVNAVKVKSCAVPCHLLKVLGNEELGAVGSGCRS